MSHIVQIAKTIMLASIAAAFIMVALFINDLRATVRAFNQIPSIMQSELRETREMANRQITGFRGDAMNKITEVQANLNKEVNGLAKVADSRLDKIQDGTLNAVVGLSKNVNAQLTTTNRTLDTLATAYINIPKTIGSRIDYYTDCDKNGLCWQGQITDSMLAWRKSSRDTSSAMDSINKTVPMIAKDWTTVSNSLAVGVPKITNNVADITHNIEDFTHPKWYWRVLGAATQGSSIYFNAARPINAVVPAK